MSRPPAVSVIIIFLNGGHFIREAVDSVLAQSFPDWELLLVDDGSTDDSSAYARDLSAAQPGRIRYLEHPGHENRGMSASRNLGLAHARGRYIALLDADDVWLPGKLQAQVSILDAHPEAGMLYGASLYWHSWSPTSQRQDTLMLARVRPDRVYRPPELLPLFLTGAAMVPCPSCILVRRDVMEQVGGFEPEFRTLYEDQVFFAKMALHAPVLVSNEYWINYRLHPRSSTAVEGSGTFPDPARIRYLDWLERYLARTGKGQRDVLATIRHQRWLQAHPRFARVSMDLEIFVRRWQRRLIPWTRPHSIRMPARSR